MPTLHQLSIVMSGQHSYNQILGVCLSVNWNVAQTYFLFSIRRVNVQGILHGFFSIIWWTERGGWATGATGAVRAWRTRLRWPSSFWAFALHEIVKRSHNFVCFRKTTDEGFSDYVKVAYRHCGELNRLYRITIKDKKEKRKKWSVNRAGLNVKCLKKKPLKKSNLDSLLSTCTWLTQLAGRQFSNRSEGSPGWMPAD